MRRVFWGVVAILLLYFVIGSFAAQENSAQTPPTPTARADSTTDPAADGTPVPDAEKAAADTETRFSVIGDYGTAGPNQDAVAQLIATWDSTAALAGIVTVGDNNYPDGSADTIRTNVGKNFGSYIEEGRFFPAIGNHDCVEDPGCGPYLEYFEVPRYYRQMLGPVELFVIDSNTDAPDGTSPTSKQGQWLKQGLAESTATWKIVVMHVPPISSGRHGSTNEGKYMAWPFCEWGADALLAGHDHLYERLSYSDGTCEIPLFVNGIGGDYISNIPKVYESSQVRLNSQYGAMLVTATSQSAIFRFYEVDSKGESDWSDEFSIKAGQKPARPTVTPTPEPTATATPLPISFVMPSAKARIVTSSDGATVFEFVGGGPHLVNPVCSGTVTKIEPIIIKEQPAWTEVTIDCGSGVKTTIWLDSGYVLVELGNTYTTATPIGTSIKGNGPLTVQLFVGGRSVSLCTYAPFSGEKVCK